MRHTPICLRCLALLCSLQLTTQWAIRTSTTFEQRLLPIATLDAGAGGGSRGAGSFSKRTIASSSSTSLQALKFDGSGIAEVVVALPPNGSSDRSLPAFLRSSESNALLLGATTFQPVLSGDSSDEKNSSTTGENEEYWEVSQRPIEWFGTRLVSTFTNCIRRPPTKNSVTISIEDARTDIVSASNKSSSGSTSSNRVNIMKNIMGRSSFTGGTELTWREEDQASTKWILKADLKLSLTVDVPNFLPLPPGFNRIGSQIVGSTCRNRIQENVQGIQQAYVKWATQGDEGNNEMDEDTATISEAVDINEEMDSISKLDNIKRSGTLDAYLP